MNSILLFTLEGCRPCVLVKKQLERARDWEKYVTLVPAENSELASKYHVSGFPTLVILDPVRGWHKVVERPEQLTKSYFETLFDTIDHNTNFSNDT